MREDEPGSRASTYRAPTWSWASMDGAVVPVASYRGSQTNVKHEICSEIELIDHHLSFADNGQLISAEIVLYGRLRPGRLTTIGSFRAPTVFGIYDNVQNTDLRAMRRGEVWLDLPLRPQKGSGFIDDGALPLEGMIQENNSFVLYQFLHVSTRQWNDGKTARTLYEVIAVEEIEGRQGEFLRIGAGYIDTDSWFDNYPSRRITIA